MIKAHNKGLLWKCVRLSGPVARDLLAEANTEDTHFLTWILRGANWRIDPLYSGLYEVIEK